MKIIIFVNEREILFLTALVITLERLTYDGQLSEPNKRIAARFNVNN